MNMTPNHLLARLAVVLWLAGTACNDATGPGGIRAGKERITARPEPSVSSVAPGSYELQVAVPRDAVLLVPTSAAAGEQHGFAVLVPKSRNQTWDLALGGYGADVPIIDKAMQETFKRLRVDPSRIALAGFSDGASYALSRGLGQRRPLYPCHRVLAGLPRRHLRAWHAHLLCCTWTRRSRAVRRGLGEQHRALPAAERL